MKPKQYPIIVMITLICIVIYAGRGLKVIDFETPNYRGSSDYQNVTITGVLNNMSFPVSNTMPFPREGGAEYLTRKVLTLMDNNSRPVFLHGGHSEMIHVSSTGNSMIKGISIDTIHDAYRLGLTVKARGRLYNETQLGKEYQIFHITDITILDPDPLPLIVYPFKVIDKEYRNNTYQTLILTNDNRYTLTHHFTVGPNNTRVFNQNVTQGFELYLRDTERLCVEWNATGSV